mmetsp:Transcript_8147/g.12086  ORF Transcript_8147/g.12086 Transcript_8147/m.12086 type:complete len:500 (+) Transcript_8147:264-1763(+)
MSKLHQTPSHQLSQIKEMPPRRHSISSPFRLVLHVPPSRIMVLLFLCVAIVSVLVDTKQVYNLSTSGIESSSSIRIVHEKSQLRTQSTNTTMMRQYLCNHNSHISVIHLCSGSEITVCGSDFTAQESPCEEHDNGLMDNIVEDTSDATATNASDASDRFTYVGDDCRPARAWQTTSRPTCNVVHEIDWMNFDVHSSRRNSAYSDATARLTFLNRGGTRIVWKANGSSTERIGFVLKTLRMDKAFSEIMLEYQRIDALAMDELTSSTNVVDVYGYCGQTVMNEIGIGDLHRAEKFFSSHGNYTSLRKLQLAQDVANAVADLQEIDKEMGPLILHRDIGPANMLIMPDGRMKLNDFNGAQMMYWDYANNHMCGYRRTKLCGEDGRRADARSPEECLGNVLSEKSDTYSIGTILFFILTNDRIYHSHEDDRKFSSDNALVREVIRKGQEPRLPSKIEESNDTAIGAIRTAMRQALIHDPVERPTARSIATLLEQTLLKIKAQ